MVTSKRKQLLVRLSQKCRNLLIIRYLGIFVVIIYC
nr:MAG TPA: hypothetical protein [Caudoviricetes sp.]